jgi:hypothetical protein
MKFKNFTLLIVLFSSFFATRSQTVTIMDFPSTETQSVQPTVIVAQNFSIPAGTDYYLTQTGIKLNEQSLAADIKLAIYNSDSELIFVSEEIHYSGATTETLTTDIAPGIISLVAENSYYIALIHNGSDFLYVEKNASATNEGVATLYEFSHFQTNSTYPDFPENISPSGSWQFNIGFTLRGEEKTTEIEPDNEILEFNTVSEMAITSDNIYSILLQMPAGETHELRQIGLKKNAGSAGEQIHFAVYNNTYDLLYQTDPVTVENNDVDTIFATIPEGTVSLEENSSYHIAFQYDGNSSIDIGTVATPIHRGIAELYDNYSRFSTDHTFPIFPDPLSNDGSYTYVFGFVLNGDPPSGTTVISEENISAKFDLYPVPTKSKLTIIPKENNHNNLKIDVFNINGEKVIHTQWNQEETIRINVARLPKGIYFISFTDSGRVIEHTKFMKK